MRVVITGATSFLGHYLVDELGRQNAEAVAIIRPSSGKRDMYTKYPHVRTILIDMDNIDAWVDAVGSADAFLHLGWDGIGASGRSDEAIQQKNVQTAMRCISGAEALRCNAFLFAGSQAEYGPQTGLISEGTPCKPVIEYGKAKLQVCKQALARQSFMKFYDARIFSVYGEGDHPWALIPNCIRTLCAGERMNLSSCMQYWNYMYAVDAARVLCGLLFSRTESGIYNVASKDTRLLKEFVEVIYYSCGKKGQLSFGTYNYSESPVSLQPDISRISSVIKEIPFTPFEEVIPKLIYKYKVKGEL